LFTCSFSARTTTTLFEKIAESTPRKQTQNADKKATMERGEAPEEEEAEHTSNHKTNTQKPKEKED